MKPSFQRLLSLALALSVALSLCAAPVWAAGPEAGDASLSTQGVWWQGTCGESAKWNTDWNDEEGTCTLTISGTGAVLYDFECEDETKLNFRDRVLQIVVKDGITSVPDLCGFFYNCTDLSLPGSLGELSSDQFCGPDEGEDSVQSSIERVTIGRGVTKIGSSAFHRCLELEQVTIPITVTEINSGAFSGCVRLAQISLPAKLETIANSLFAGCSSLRSVDIPASVSELQSYCFDSCKSLDGIIVPGEVKTIGKGAFYGCSGLSDITLEEGVKTLEDWVFLKCARLDSITIPSTVTKIGKCAVGYWDESTKMPDFVIRGYTGSAAETYAKENGITFQSIGTLPELTRTTLKSVKAKKGQKIEVKWKRNKKGGGYELQCSTSRKFKSILLTSKINSNAVTSKTVKKLKAGKTYYFRIRTIWGSRKSKWSEIKGAKAKK